jgi:hypothetical protein
MAISERITSRRIEDASKSLEKVERIREGRQDKL